MANRTKFANDFRASVASMLDAYDRVMALVAQHKAMAWQPGAFADAVGNDITAEEFDAAIEACGGLTEGFAPLANTLAKMRS